MGGRENGSSPLARGLHIARGLRCRVNGIIPARAGFTMWMWSGAGVAADHPRSRGVYECRRHRTLLFYGSSPLARGLPPVRTITVAMGRIIPARAGFTALRSGPFLLYQDHPRSRGVYGVDKDLVADPDGSSPLARGLRIRKRPPHAHRRIIPARAGFTPVVRCRQSKPGGSSPLARGLLRVLRRLPLVPWIIPARAGFTPGTYDYGGYGSDHPRSRGVYETLRILRNVEMGSSPLARGLHALDDAYAENRGIIPARAGFTQCD